MGGQERRPNFTLLWAAGAFSAMCWLLEPLVTHALSSGGAFAAVVVLPDPQEMWVRAGIVLLFVLMGLYEQAMLSRLERTERRYHDLVERIPDVTWTADPDGARAFVSPNVERVLGCPPNALLAPDSEAWWERVHPDDLGAVRAAYCALFETETPFDLEYRMRRADDRWLWVHDRAMATYAQRGRRFADGVLTDVTERKEAQEALHYVSYFDPLTGLPNRTLLRDRLGQALTQRRRHGHHVAVVLVEIVGLRQIHDTHDGAAAEAVLKDVVALLKASLREEDTIARWGMDDLAIILPEIPESTYSAHVAQKLVRLLDTVAEFEGTRLPLGGCAGVAVAPQHGADADTLLRNGATALEQAKRMGRHTCQVYTRDMRTRAAHRLKVEAALRQALERDQIRVYYQPQVDLSSGRVVGMEALARWEDPERGLILPGEFVPLAEETGLVVPLGLRVLWLACRQVRAWADAGIPPVRVSVNVSGRHFWEQGLDASVRRVLADTRLEPELLELEITEGTMMQNVEQTIRTLDRLKAMNLRLAIDDFGTGHASLAYLKRFPVDTLKIDRAFVTDCPRDPDDAALTRAIIAMAHSLRLSVVAEGVEEADQLAFLKAHDCDVVQGFLFGHPQPPERMMEMLAEDAPVALPAGASGGAAPGSAPAPAAAARRKGPA